MQRAKQGLEPPILNTLFLLNLDQSPTGDKDHVNSQHCMGHIVHDHLEASIYDM